MNNRDKKQGGPDKNDAGVSPVVGVILMVAITVIMAAIVASWSSGIRAPTTPTTVGLDIERIGTNITTVITSIDPPSSAPIPLLNISYQNWSQGLYVNYTNITYANVGDNIEINTSSSSNLSRIIIVATYKDGSKKVLYNRQI
ncbi:MAG: type IV pilin N-terminal domain-containing protein [Candidatus Methanoperedens sp.]|nr:type IV pilin N-terminal domain-containing protein [Candidatus Methanoperedens sp.]